MWTGRVARWRCSPTRRARAEAARRPRPCRPSAGRRSSPTRSSWWRGRRPARRPQLLAAGTFSLEFGEATNPPAQQLTLWDLQDFFASADKLAGVTSIALCAYVVDVGGNVAATAPPDTASASAVVQLATPALSPASVMSALQDRLAQQLSTVDIRWVATHPYCIEPARFPVAGSASISWIGPGSTLVAHGVQTASASGVIKRVRMHITKRGGELLRRVDNLNLTLSESLTPPAGGGKAATASVPFVLRRQPPGISGALNGCVVAV